METFKAIITENNGIATAYNPDFDMAVDADCVNNAILGLSKSIEETGVAMLKNGENLPKAIDIAITPTQVVAYITTDIETKFKTLESGSVRKNISLPTWMDIRLKTNGIDASALFQEAANKKLEELSNAKPFTQLDSIEALTKYVDDELLKKFAKYYLSQL